MRDDEMWIRSRKTPLVILNPKSPGLHAGAVLVGFVVNPVFFVWLGLVL